MDGRKSGILTHISSLPSKYGIGDLGPNAYAFVNFLHEAKQKIWQILPLNPTNTLTDNSPYSSPSAFAGNRLLISPELLVEQGLLERKDFGKVPRFSEAKVNYPEVIKYKTKLLRKAVKRFDTNELNYQAFIEENKFWLDDYAVFMWLKRKHGKKFWNKWPKSYRLSEETSIEALREKHKEEISEFYIVQFLFFKQWSLLKNYCYQKNVQILGDIPIYVHYDSVDVWQHPKNFKLDGELKPAVVAGAPPDAFSEEGQRWGNPVYDWQQLQRDHFDWWMKRIHYNLKLFDWVRIDHFRGLINYWEIPYKEKSAKSGRWMYAPTDAFFDTLNAQEDGLPIIAEDLGDISHEVREKINKIGLPGMKVLQFAFDHDINTNPYLPHNYDKNCVVYTGTHDNNTTIGWFEGLNEWERHNVLNYLSRESDPYHEAKTKDIQWQLIRLAAQSKANWAIFPMQDILGLDEKGRMNVPGVKKGNWKWRLQSSSLSDELTQKMALISKNTKR